LEWVIVVAALSVVVFWGFGGAANHPNLRAIVWGLLAISATEVYTFYSAVLFAYINEVASEFADREHST